MRPSQTIIDRNFAQWNAAIRSVAAEGILSCIHFKNPCTGPDWQRYTVRTKFAAFTLLLFFFITKDTTAADNRNSWRPHTSPEVASAAERQSRETPMNVPSGKSGPAHRSSRRLQSLQRVVWTSEDPQLPQHAESTDHASEADDRSAAENGIPATGSDGYSHPEHRILPPTDSKRIRGSLTIIPADRSSSPPDEHHAAENQHPTETEPVTHPPSSSSAHSRPTPAGTESGHSSLGFVTGGQHALAIDGPIDRMGLADNLYQIGELVLALEMYEQISTVDISRTEKYWIQYQTACCLRKLGRPAEAQKVYRQLAETSEAGWLRELSVWWLDRMTERIALEADIQNLQQFINQLKEQQHVRSGN